MHERSSLLLIEVLATVILKVFCQPLKTKLEGLNQ